MTAAVVSAIDAAVVQQLAADPTVAAFCGPAPNGVYFATAPQGATRYVSIDRDDHKADRVLPGGVALDKVIYQIRAWDKDSSGAAVEACAAAIRAALERGAGGYAITGYALVSSLLVSDLRRAAVDDATNTIWQFCGGRYEVQAAPIS